jgi:hypothetical protein
MSALLQSSNVKYAVIQVRSTKGSLERLVVAYPNEETLRGLIANPSIVDVGFSSRDEAASTAAAALTKGAAPRKASGLAGLRAELTFVHRVRGRPVHRTSFLPFRKLATSIVQLGLTAAFFVFYSRNVVSGTVRAFLAGSV